MSHLSFLLRIFTEGKYVDQLNGRPDDEFRAAALRDMQQRFDHLGWSADRVMPSPRKTAAHKIQLP
ncbi:MAG TPA: hypothetical protein VE485_14425, partial [Mycobacterium sp.]|nr:hypothetical protein [Mycobacterium sp.]